jgi:hypothetical protein
VKNKIKDKYIYYNFVFMHPPPLLSCEAVQAGNRFSFFAPHPPLPMPEMKDFVAALAKAIRVRKEIKFLTGLAYGNKSLKRIQIFQIIKDIKDGKNTADKSK